MATFQNIATTNTLQCEVRWLGWVGGFFQYHYHTFGRPLDKKVEYLAQAILKSELHQDALLFTNQFVLEGLQNYFENKASVDKIRFVRYIGYTYLQAKKGPLFDVLEKIGMAVHQSIRSFSDQAAGRAQIVERSQSVALDLPPPPRSSTVLFPEDLYAAFSLKKESSKEEKEVFIKKMFDKINSSEREQFVAHRESLSANNGLFFEFLKVSYATLIDTCFGSFVTMPYGLSLMMRAKKIQEWIKEHSPLEKSSLTIVGGVGYLPWQEMSAYENLISLDISKNAISSIPDSISAFRNLQILDARINEIQYISPQISSCRKLRWAFFDHNKLAEVPSELWKLPVVQHISLTNNQMTTLPDTFPQEQRIFVNVADNPLATCKQSFLNKPNLSLMIPQETQIIKDL